MPPKSGDVTSSGLFVTKTRFRFAFHEDGGGEGSPVTANPGLVTGMAPGGLGGGSGGSGGGVGGGPLENFQKIDFLKIGVPCAA